MFSYTPTPDEYRFFSKYPEKELRITGIIYGLLIKEQLITSVTLGIGLRYVLEALRKSPSQSPQSGKMFRFGLFALEQFKERLHEWPQYCSHIVEISHLRDGYAALVGEIEDVTTEGSLAQQAIIASTKGLVPPGSAQQVQTTNSIVPSSNPWEPGWVNKTDRAESKTTTPTKVSSGTTLNKGDDKGSEKSAVSIGMNNSSTDEEENADEVDKEVLDYIENKMGELSNQGLNKLLKHAQALRSQKVQATRSQPIGFPSSGGDKGSDDNGAVSSTSPSTKESQDKGAASSTTSPSTVITSSGLGLLNEENNDDIESTVLEEDMGTKLRLF